MIVWKHSVGSEVIDVTDFRCSSYWGPSPQAQDREDFSEEIGPQAFLVELSGERPATPTHYHPVDQFQYFTAGSGRFGRDPIEPGVLHYADRFTPYGPIRQGEQGAAFLTLRYAYDYGSWHMPDTREHLRVALADNVRDPSNRRSMTVHLHEEDAGTDWTDVVHESDGLRVAIADLGPGQSIEAPPAERNGGYLVVVRGEVDSGGDVFGADSVALMDPGSTGEVRAGTTGARIAALFLPVAPPVLARDGTGGATRESSGQPGI